MTYKESYLACKGKEEFKREECGKLMEEITKYDKAGEQE